MMVSQLELTLLDGWVKVRVYPEHKFKEAFHFQ